MREFSSLESYTGVVNRRHSGYCTYLLGQSTQDSTNAAVPCFDIGE